MKATVKSRFERFSAQAGILDQGKAYVKPYAKVHAVKGKNGLRTRGLTTVAGGPARFKSSTASKLTIAQVAEFIRKRTGVNYLTAPFAQKNSLRMKTLRKEIGRLITGEAKSYSKLQTALREVIRYPILRLKYGKNKPSTVKRKGFDRYLFDTGQFYQNLKAKVQVKRVQK